MVDQMKKILDISIWQDEDSTPQGFDPYKAKAQDVDGVMIKTSQANWMDEDYRMNWNTCRGVLKRGGYHFLTWDVSPIVQARYFYGLLKDDPGELRPAVDYEWWKTVPSNALTILRSFLTEFMTLMPACKPLIYTAPGFWRGSGSKDIWWAQFPLWVAHYIDAPAPTIPLPWTSYTIWQYSSHGDGHLHGCESGNVDLNRCSDESFALISGQPYISLEEKVNRLWAQHPELHGG